MFTVTPPPKIVILEAMERAQGFRGNLAKLGATLDDVEGLFAEGWPAQAGTRMHGCRRLLSTLDEEIRSTKSIASLGDIAARYNGQVAPLRARFERLEAQIDEAPPAPPPPLVAERQRLIKVERQQAGRLDQTRDRLDALAAEMDAAMRNRQRAIAVERRRMQMGEDEPIAHSGLSREAIAAIRQEIREQTVASVRGAYKIATGQIERPPSKPTGLAKQILAAFEKAKTCDGE
jgi:hypothetical protein